MAISHTQANEAAATFPGVRPPQAGLLHKTAATLEVEGQGADAAAAAGGTARQVPGAADAAAPSGRVADGWHATTATGATALEA